MPKIDELKVYKTSYDLHLQIYKSTSNINREYKYSLVQDIKRKSLKLLLDIYRANYDKDKRIKYLRKALEKCEFLRISFRVLKDLYIVSLKKFINLVKILENIQKQLVLWLRYLEI